MRRTPTGVAHPAKTAATITIARMTPPGEDATLLPDVIAFSHT
jgi:hypothetical protein